MQQIVRLAARDTWLDGLRAQFTGAEGPALSDALAALNESLRALPGMDLNFANALAGLAEKRFSPLAQGEAAEDRANAREVLYQWFEGGKVAKGELKAFQVFELLNKSNSKRMLSSLIALLRHLGHQGLILLMDELETVLAQSGSVRNAAYENVRLFIDNTEHAQHLHIFFSIIPDVLLSEKGFKSYGALWSRVRSIGEGKRLNFRGVLIDLHRTPLEVRELIELGLALRRIHEISYRWEAGDLVPDSRIEKVCTLQKKMGLLSEVRLFIKQIIRLLDMAEQGEVPNDEDALIGQLETSQREIEQQKIEEAQPRWDT